MARQRIRDWPQRVIAYHVDDVQLTPEAWIAAHRMRDAWNDLVVLGAIAAGQAKAEPNLKRIHWWCWDLNARQIASRYSLTWEMVDDLIDRYRTACKNIGLNDKGPPRQHYGPLKQVRFMHRYTGGGLPFSRLIDSRAWRCSMSMPETGHGHGTATFGVTQDALITMRPVFMCAGPRGQRRLRLPSDDAIVKRSVMCGSKTVFGWQWSLQFTIEEPPRIAAENMHDERPVAGLDVGWRIMHAGDVDREYLRLGVLVDSTGRTFELRLPFRADTSRNYGGWRELWAYDTLIAEQLEAVKAQLVGAVPPNALRLMRQSGLHRLLDSRTLSSELHAALESWSIEDEHLHRRRCGLHCRLIANRQILYRTLAKWLCTRYRVVALENDMSLKTLAEQNEQAPAIQAAQRYRVMASLSVLRTYINQAGRTHGSQIGGNAAQTTATCHECCGKVEVGAMLALSCENGHLHDQDFNAGVNLLSQALGAREQIRGLRSRRLKLGPEVLELPERLRAVATECSLE